MSDSDFGPVGDPPIIQGGTDYYTTDGYGRKTWLVDRRLLEQAQARIAELERVHAGMDSLAAVLDSKVADLAAERDRWRAKYLRESAINRLASEPVKETVGGADVDDFVDGREARESRVRIAELERDLRLAAAERDRWKAEAEKARTQSARHRQVREIAEEALERGALNVPRLARLIIDVLGADRLESEATADDVVEKATDTDALALLKSDPQEYLRRTHRDLPPGFRRGES